MVRFQVTRLACVDSTNRLVKEAIEHQAAEGAVFRARVQTGGYGRQGRSWSSPEGGLYQSLLLRPAVPVEQLPTLGLVVALAVRRAIVQVACLGDGFAVQLKWPNDVVCAAGKLAGISFESHAGGLCVGIGANVFHPAEERPVGGKNVPAYVEDVVREAAVRAAAGCDAPVLTVDSVGDAILDQFAPLYDEWQRTGFAPLCAEFNRVASLNGQSVRVETLDGSLVAQGPVQRVADDGQLVVQTPEGPAYVHSGEAHLV